MDNFYSVINTKIGDLILTANQTGLTTIEYFSQERLDRLRKNFKSAIDRTIFLEARDWFDDYFAGKNPEIERLATDPKGTDFQKEVWHILRKIPFGKTVTYGDIATEIVKKSGKKSMSAQAVGHAIGQNPLVILTPCHRVLGQNNNLTGYSGGIDRKIFLLEHEGLNTKDYHLPK